MPHAHRSTALWTIAATLVGAACQLIQLAVAARHLDAHAFGALAIVNIMMTLVSSCQDMGLSSYAIHLGEVPRRSRSTLFWVSTALGALGTALVLASTVPLARFYDIPELLALLPLLSLIFVIVGASNPYQAQFVRVFRARELALIELAARLLSFALTLALLVGAGWGAMALVVGLEAFWLLRLLLMAAHASADWHPRLEFNRGFARGAFSYGSFQTGGQIINQLGAQLDQLVLGRVLGAEALGLYAIAKDLVSYPLRVMQPVIVRLTLPLYALHQADAPALRAAFDTGLRKTAGYSALVFAPVALLAPWIVEILYVPAFAAAAGLLPLMALAGMLRAINLNTALLAQATGQARLEYRWQLRATLASLAPTLLVAALAPSLTGFAVTQTAVQLLLALLLYPWFLRPLLPVGMPAYLRAWGPSLLLTAAACAVAVAGLLPLPSLRALLAL